jgi:hypothetical protein
VPVEPRPEFAEARSLGHLRVLNGHERRLVGLDGIVVDIMRELIMRTRDLRGRASDLERQMVRRVRPLAPTLLNLAGVARSRQPY